MREIEGFFVPGLLFGKSELKLTKSDMWLPIIEPSKSSIYQIKIEEIITSIEKELPQIQRIGLLGGIAGLSVFFFYYAQMTGIIKYYRIASRLLSQAVQSLPHLQPDTFSKGLAGVLWSVAHIKHHKSKNMDIPPIPESINGILFDLMMDELSKLNYDPLHGAIGYGTYFLEYEPPDEVSLYLSNLVKGLKKISHKKGKKRYWKTINEIHSIKGVNSGLTHGMAGIVVFLSRLYKTGICKEIVLELLEGAVEYFLYLSDLMKTKAQAFSSFPVWVSNSGELTEGQLALGYGDLSVGLALWHASNALENNVWKEKALDVFSKTITRSTKETNNMKDASLSLGTSGMAHLYNRIYHYTGDERFKEAAHYWLFETLEMGKSLKGVAGYSAWRGESVNRRDKEFGIIEGIAGIGLVLISCISPIEPLWDKCLMVS